MSSAVLKKIGIINGSIRPVQSGSQITDFVQAVIEKQLGSSSNIELVRINLRDQDLPIGRETLPAGWVKTPDQYADDSTRAWSSKISPLDGFVILTPEYNCTLPAGLKNAIDLLWHEWTTKPFLPISYGIMGGTFAYEDLKRALTLPIKARSVETPVNLALGRPDPDAGPDLKLSADREDSKWADKKPDIVKAWGELVDLVNNSGNPVPAE